MCLWLQCLFSGFYGLERSPHLDEMNVAQFSMASSDVAKLEAEIKEYRKRNTLEVQASTDMADVINDLKRIEREENPRGEGTLSQANFRTVSPT